LICSNLRIASMYSCSVLGKSGTPGINAITASESARKVM